MAQTPDDRWANPLKHAHHMRQHAHGDEIGWWAAHGIRDVFTLALMFNARYRHETGKDAAEHFPLKRVRKSRPKRERQRAASGLRPVPKQKMAHRPRPWPKGRKIKSRGFK